MKTLSLNNADVVIPGQPTLVGGRGGGGFTYTYDQAPVELDMISGAWWLWPIRRGRVEIESILEPGDTPPSLPPSSLTPVDITVYSGGHTLVIPDAVYVGIELSVEQLGEAMPALKETAIYMVFKDDNTETGNYP